MALISDAIIESFADYPHTTRHGEVLAAAVPDLRPIDTEMAWSDSR